MSKNNAKVVQQKMSDQRQKFGIRKLSVGVASVLLGTVFYMQGGTVHADVNSTVSSGDNSVNVVNENSGTSSLVVGSGMSSSAGSANSASPVVSASDVTNSIATSQAFASSVDSAAGQVSNTVSAVSDQGSVTPVSQANVGVDKIVKNEKSNVDSDSTQVPNSQVAPEKSVAGSGSLDLSGATPSQSVLATPAETEVPVVNLAVDSKVNIAYTANDQAIKINYVDSDTNDPVDLTKWTYDVDNLGNAHVLSYNGDVTQPIYIPNSYDFIQAGKITAEHKAFITSDNMQKLAGSGTHELYISKNGDGKVVAEDSDWHGTFCGIGRWSGRNAQLSDTIGKNLEKLDLTNLDVTNIQNMGNMFSYTSKLTNIGDLSNWDTSKVTNMSGMFYKASNLTNIGDLSNWDTRNVTGMSSMFSGASKLTNIGDLSNWDTSNVTEMSYMFDGASKLTNIGDLSNWNTSNVTRMSGMFSGASKLTNIGDLSNWDTSKVTDMSYMFEVASKLTNIGDLSNWDTSKVTDMSYMFSGTSKLTNIGDLSNWDTSKVTNMSDMFGGASKLTNIGDLSNWDTSKVTNMSGMFSDTSSLTNIGDLSNWDTHNVANMSSMFQGASSLTNIGDLSNWDTSKVTYMSYMFDRALKLTNIGDLSNWDTHNVIYMMYMFSGASSLTNIGDLSNWDTSKVTYMNDMFSEASSLTNIGDLSNWDTHNVTNMSAMFYRTFNLTNVGDLSKWNVNNVVYSQNIMESFGKDSREPILQKLPSFTKTKNSSSGLPNSSSGLPIAATGTGVYDARGITSDVQRTSADDYWNNHIVLTSDTSLLDHFNISNNVNRKINQITINGNKIALPVFYKDYQDLHDTVQKTIDDYAEKLRSQGKIVKSTPKVADYSTEPTTDWLKYFTNYTIDVVNQTKINYVDTDGNTIHTTVIEGKSGETVSVPNEIPTGYKLVAGLSVPTEITFTADGYPITNLAIEAIHTTVTADNPKTTADKLPDNPTKNYPEGVSESDLNKTVIRTINITDPRTQKVTPVVQTVHLTRSADVDEITGKVVYSDWTTSSFDSYNVPEVPGYTSSQTSVAKETVTSDTKDQTVNITYTANDHQISVKYVDDDQGEKVVGTGTVNGKTGAEVTITPSLPKGYMLTPGKDVPSTYTVTAGDNQAVTIHVQKQFVDTSATDPQAKQTRTVTLHYVYGVGDKQGQKAFDDAVLNVYYHRTATLDRATNQTKYGDWLWDQSQGDPSMPGYHVVSGKWTNLPQHWANVTVDVPSIKGYHADLGQNDPANTNHVPANIWVYPTWNGAASTGDTLDGLESKAYQTSAHLYEVQPEHTVKYMPNKTTLTVKYIDDDHNGAVVGSQHWDGITGQHINLTLTPPDNYVLSPGWVNPTNYDFDGVNNAWYNVHVKHAVQTQTVTSQLTIHYVNSEDHKQELKAPTVITRQYTRTNVSHNDGTTQYGDWSYVPGSFKQTGTQITVNDSDNPVKQDNVYNADENENMDGFTMIVRYPTIEDYAMHDGISGVRSTDWLGNSDRQAATMTDNFYAEYDEHKERSIAVKFVDDQAYEQQVGQATAVTGRDGDTVDLKLTVPDKYQLADGQQLPTSYTFAKGSGDLVIHLTHKVVQREATINVKLSSDTLVRITDDRDGVTDVVPQTHWAQLDDKIKKSPDLAHYVMPSVDVGTLTGHVNYDLVDEGIVSFGNDWTTLNLGGRTYQMPDGDDVVNGVVFDFNDGTSEKFKEGYLKYHPDTDLDYVNRSWHSYLSANVTKNLLSHESGPMLGSVLQAGLVGNKPNTLAKATGDHAATSVEMGDTTIDLGLLQSFDFETRDFSEQNGQLRADGFVPVVGVYIPYVEKTVTRTINVVTPDGKTTAVKQTATLAKQVDLGKDVHPEWTTGEWTSYDVPTIVGYTASQSQVAKETVTGETKDQTVNITYTANPQTTTVVYQSEDGTLVHTTTVNGHTGQTVKVSNEVPAGWHVVNGNVPSEIIFGPDGAPKTVVTIDHSHVTVTPDAPKTTTDHLPDNPGKTYPAGVGHDDLNKTVTRTIKVTMPDGQVKTVLKTAKLTRTADVDEVTGEVTYSDWTTGYWSDYTAPVVPGYTADYPYIAGHSVTGAMTDQTLEITYTANDQSTHVNYVDTQGKTIHTTTVNGKTNQTVDVPNEVPTGWKLVDGQTVPSEITFGPTGYVDTSVKIEHQHVTVTPDHPQINGTKLPNNPAKTFNGVEANDLNKTITRTIKVTTPDGQTKTVTRTVKLTRTATVDEVTGDVSYGKWTTGQWAKYDVPAVNGYTASQTSVAATPVDGITKDQTITISYTANSQTTHINYADEAGKTVHTTTVTGKTGETVKVPNEVPTGWMITKGQVPIEISFGPNGHTDETITISHRHVTVDSDHPQINGTKLPDNPAKTFNGVEENDLNKTITRTIKVTTSDGKTTTTKQTTKLTRTATVDEVTGDVTYSNWSTGQWGKYDVPVASGYTATKTEVAVTTVDEHTSDQTVEVSYSPNKQTTTVKYVDDKGDVVHATTVDGVTNQTVKVPSEVPAGWMITKGKVPSELTFGADGHEPIEVTVAHQHVTVTPDHSQTNGTRLPDNSAKTFNGVEANDLNKTVTRTIKVTTPDGQTKAITQTATLTRTADVDEVTGEVTYSKWTAGQWNAYEVPALNGYTASQISVEAAPVDENTKDQTVEVSYTPNKQSTMIKYVDDNGQTIHTTTVNGVTDQTVKVSSEVPAGWTITKGKVPSEITFGADGHEPIEVTVVHQHVTVDSNHPQNNGTELPDNPAKTVNGVEANDLNKTITRTIKVTTPDGKVTTTKQTVKLTRTADVDEVTGEVTYGKWTTGEWNTYEVPILNGYTASQTSVEAAPVDENTKDQTVEVSYTPNKQSTTIKYVDDKGDVVHMTTVTGVTDQTVKVPDEVPAGWTITKVKVPSEITFGADGHEPVVITVAHQHVTVDPDHPQTNGTKLPDNPAKTFEGVEANDLNKIITRTIKVTTPDGQTKTVAQTVKLTRTADVDEVTGDVSYGKWTTGQWAKYDVPAVNGYTATQTEVAATAVDEHTTDQTVDVSYTPNKQTTTVKYVDDKGDVVHTTTIDGVTNQTVKVPSEVPAGWMITKGQVPSELTFGADGHEPIEVTVVHHHVTVDPDHPQTNGTKLPDNPAKTFNGVEANDLNKTITRTIKVTTPDGKTTTTTQAAKLTRTASVDEVTGEVAYGNWTTSEWAAYSTPSVVGYTPSQAVVAKESVTVDSKDTAVEITYTPNQYQISVEYIDDDDHGKIVKTDQVPGKTDQTITVTPSAPANYDLVDNGNRTYTVTSGDGQRVQIHVKHHQVTTSESKTVARMINVYTPHDRVKTVKQTVELNRDVTTDQVTGDKTYGNWTTGQWKAYTPEAIPGYTPSANDVPSANVDGSSTDQTVDVTYTANAQHVDIVYVDDAKDGAVVKTDQVAGKTDETVKVTPSVPTGYKVVGEVSGSYTMTADGRQTITVHLVHQMKTASESKAVTRTISVDTPHDGTTVFKQTVDLSRDVTTDQVTGDKTYGDWSTTEWTHYDVPAVAGYTPSIKQVAQQVVDGTTKDQTVNVIYTANAQTTHVNYVDGDGNVVHTTTITGKTDQTVKVPNEIPAGWKVVGEAVPTEITFGSDGHADVAVTVDHQHVTVTPDDPKTPADKLPNNPGKTYPDGVGHNDLNRTVTRTIKVVTPDGQTKTVAQKVQLTRTADVDEVTGKVTYGEWTTGEWSRYEVPSVPGYTPSQSDVPAVNVTDTTKDQMLTLTYTANDQTTHVNYVDGNGKTVHMTTITGKTDQTVKVPNEVPTGWTITDGQVSAEITFGPNGHSDVTVTVGHQHVTVTPDQPKTPSDKLPNSPGKTYPTGVGHDDLNKTVTRTVKVTTPDGKTQTTEQKVQLIRTANVDEVTGEVTYSDWTTGEWANFDVPAVPGYTASQRNVPAAKVTSDTKNQTVTVTYTANAQTTTISYVDQNGKTVHTTVVNGHTDQTVKVPNETPAGWTITNGQVPTEITFGPNGHDHVTVTVDHKHVTVTPDKPQTDGTKLPDNPSQTFHGVGHDDLNKTIVRTIEVTAPTGKTKTIKQTAKLTRSANVDEVTGEVVYGDWTTTEWLAFIVPIVPGYTPSQKIISSIIVKSGDKDVEETVIYSPNKQVMTINYIDDVTGKTLSTKQIIGVSDASANYNTKSSVNSYIVDNYKLVSDDTNGDNLVFDHDDSTDQVYNVHLSHQTEPASQSRTVNETINYVYADGSKAADTVTAKPLTFTQTGVKDLVNGNIDWNGTWTFKQTFAEVKSPEIIGYTASRASVDPIIVDHNSSDIHQTVIYVANDQTAKIKYIDDTTGKTLETDSANGKFGNQIKFGHDIDTQIKAFEGQGYKFKSNSFNGQKYQADNSRNEFEVYFTHGTQNVSRTDKVTETVKYQFEDGRQAQKNHVQTAEFMQHGVQDLVTKTTVWTLSDPQTFVNVDTPKIIGYTADIQIIPAATVKFGDADIIKVVTYKANDQLAGIKYIDDTVGKVLDTEAASGKFGTKIEFMHDPSSMTQKFEGQGYKLVSNSFKDQDYQADNSKNQFEVHFIHGTQNVSRTNKVTETVKYQFADGRQAQKDHVQTVEFTQYGVKDLVTKAVDWVPIDPQTFVNVDTPYIIGYTADVQNVPEVTVNFGNADITKVVTYKANDQLAGIKYIDDTTGKRLDTDSSNGKFGDQIKFGHDPSSMIKKFEGQGYKLVSNSVKDQDYQADNSKNQFEVHFKHGMKDVIRTSTITRTIKYVDQNTGKEVHQPVIQTLTFTENGVTDLVTGETTWNTPNDQQFVKVESPKIDGYENPDILVVDAKTAKFGDSDQTVTVRYQKVETPSNPDTLKEPNDSSTPSMTSTQNESNISTVSIHTPTQVGSQNASDQKIVNNHGESQLPQTGNQNSHQSGLVGLISLTLAGLLGFVKRRKKND